jgi:hypothetical protein
MKTDTRVAHVVCVELSPKQIAINIACTLDIPAHCYQLSFESNPAWSQFYATAPEILKYWEKVAAKHDVQKYMKFRSKVTTAQWNDEAAKWKVTIQPTGEGSPEFSDEADVLISAVGLLNEWRWPQIPGLHDFKGELLHSAAWRPDFEHKVGEFPTILLILWANWLLGQESGRHRSRLKRHSDRTFPSTRSPKVGPLCQGQDLDCHADGR